MQKNTDNPKIKKEGNIFIIDFIKTIKGRRIHVYKKGFKTYEEALAYIPILLQKRINESTKILVNTKFKDFFKSHLEHRSHKVSKSTLISIKQITAPYFERFMDSKTSEVFQVHNVLGIYKEIIERKDLTEKSKNHIIGEIRFMVDHASFLKLIDPITASDDKVILENVSITRAKKKEKECYNIKQLNDFFSVITSEEDRDLFKVFSYLGARISEFVGLTWDCYDPINKTIEIKQQVLYQQVGKPIISTSLKTKESYRKCKLNDEVYAILEKRRKRCKRGFIFPRKLSTPNVSYPKTRLRNKMLKYMELANLPKISPHGFRHTKATMFMAVCTSMAEVKAAARFLGHSVTTMIETYAHEEDRIIDTLINRLDERQN